MFNEIQATFFILRKWKVNPMQTKREIGVLSHWQRDLPENNVALSEEEVSEMKDFLRKNATESYFALFSEEGASSTFVESSKKTPRDLGFVEEFEEGAVSIQFVPNKGMSDEYGFSARFRAMSDQELIEAFNHEVGNTGWVSARATYHAALRDELNNRGIDYSAIGNSQCLSFAHKIRLDGKKIVIE